MSDETVYPYQSDESSKVYGTGRDFYGDALPTPPPDASENYTLTHDDILVNNDDFVSRFVHTPEWAPKGHPHPERFGVWVRAVTAPEHAKWLDASVSVVGKVVKTNFLGGLFALVLPAAIDGPTKDAKPLFTTKDLGALYRKNVAPLKRLGDVISELSGIGEEDLAILGKGGETDPDGSSPIG